MLLPVQTQPRWHTFENGLMFIQKLSLRSQLAPISENKTEILSLIKP
jgi:hypothetical protein